MNDTWQGDRAAALRAVFGSGKMIGCYFVPIRDAPSLVAAARAGDPLAFQVFGGVKQTVEAVSVAQKQGEPIACPGCLVPIADQNFDVIVFRETVEDPVATPPAGFGCPVCHKCGGTKEKLRAVAIKFVHDQTGSARVIEAMPGVSGSA